MAMRSSVPSEPSRVRKVRGSSPSRPVSVIWIGNMVSSWSGSPGEPAALAGGLVSAVPFPASAARRCGVRGQARPGGPGAKMFPGGEAAVLRERSLAARDERSESPACRTRRRGASWNAGMGITKTQTHKDGPAQSDHSSCTQTRPRVTPESNERQQAGSRWQKAVQRRSAT